jgi:hypothetical protein
MTKKIVYILLGAVLAIGVLGAAGFAYAQVADNPENETAVVPQDGFHAGFRGRRGGHWFGFGGEGILGGYVFDEMAEVFGLSDEAIAAFEKVKETMMGIKDDYTPEEIREMTKEALSEAIDAALADEAITQEQADRMLERLEQAGERKFGRFGGPGQRDGGLVGQYMEAALADALDFSVEEFRTLKAEEGFNIADYAVEQDMTVEELQEWLRDVYTSAIDAALDDGAITQDQADRLYEHLEDLDGRMFFGPRFPFRGKGK